MKRTLTKSQQNYLNAVYEIVKKNNAARVKDVANYLEYGASSTSEAIKELAAKSLINYTPYGLITLTEDGLKTAEEKFKRAQTLSNFLENVLSVEQKEAEISAREIEFAVSDEILQRFECFLEFIKICPCHGSDPISNFKYFAQNGELSPKCIECTNYKK